MIQVGLTGGIGSGKSTVAKVFELLHVPVFYADDVAKTAYNEPEIRDKMVKHFGEIIYTHAELNKPFLAARIFQNTIDKAFVESLVHPFVANAYKRFKSVHASSPYIIREAAILIESGSYKDCDQIILITAPLEAKVKRVIQRDGISEAQVIERINKQMTDDQRQSFATQIWHNDNRFPLLETILRYDNFLRA